MSQAFTRILDNQSNKLLANLPSNDVIPGLKMDLSAPMVQPIPQIQNAALQVQSMPAQSPQVGDGTQECKGIKLLGFEFTVYTLILVVVLIVCVAYFLYKYFFTRTDLVVYKKNLPKEIREIKGVKENKEIKKNKDKIKEEELSNRSNASNTSSSSTNQTLEM
jgi:hypothetical protein